MKLVKLDFMRLDARSGWYKKLHTSSKAALINHGLKSGLPVPNGVLLLDSAWDRLIESGILSVKGGHVTVEAADELLERFALHKLRRPVAVRPAFAWADDSAEKDNALPITFPTQLNIVPTDKVALINALIDMWRVPLPDDISAETVRRDILVMEMVETKIGGTAFTQSDFEDDLIQPDNAAQEILPKIKSLESSSLPAGWRRRLQQLLRGVRLTFNLHGTDWEMTWADDGERCWLLQLRPILTPSARDETFDAALLTQLWPDATTPFAVSVLSKASADLLARYHDLDQTLPQNRPMIDLINGQPMLNLSLLDDISRAWGLSSGDKATTRNWVRTARKAWVLWRSRTGGVPLKGEPNSGTEQFADLAEQFCVVLVSSLMQLVGPLASAETDAKSVAIKTLANLRQLALDKAEMAVENGQLPTQAHLWRLSLEQWGELDEGRVFSAEVDPTPRTKSI